jgi:hypothetical protein
MIGVQLHFKKLVGDHQDMLDLVNAKIRAIGEQAEPDVEELAKLKRIRHSLQLELDKLRYSNLEV